MKIEPAMFVSLVLFGFFAVVCLIVWIHANQIDEIEEACKPLIGYSDSDPVFIEHELRCQEVIKRYQYD